ncbi:hypothetical protein R1sor_000718 [Riccia sorocarpa]|uniref:Uncharacterized protein n=1 Tax=Riccia sorocarpa TaxID=122646 RepID=A0ABD3GVU9_9MARC
MGPEESSKRLHTVKLMKPEFLLDYCNESSADIIRSSQFIPYSLKKLNEVELVEFSVLQALKMIKYVTAVQRHCILVDVLFWTIFNTDAEGDRLVIKGANGNAYVIGWPEIAVAFGSQHDPKEEFRSTKVMQSKLQDLHPDLFLPQAVESNPNKKLVNGWSHMTKDDDMTLSSLVARLPDPIINLQDVRENYLLLEQIPLATLCKDFWPEVLEEVGNACTWKRKHDDLLRANGEFTSRLAEKDKNFLAKEVEWKNTLAALRDELTSVRVVDSLASKDFRKQLLILEENLKEKIAQLQEEQSSKKWLQEQYNFMSEQLREKQESLLDTQAEATEVKVRMTTLECSIMRLENELRFKESLLTEAQREIETIKTKSRPIVEALKDKLSSLEAELSAKTLAWQKYKNALDDLNSTHCLSF